jgi:hypothetical protein
MQVLRKAIAVRRGVARVFTFADVAPEKIDAQARSPRDGKDRDQRASRLDSLAVRDQKADERDDAESGAPENVDDARVAQLDAEQPQRHHACEQHCCSDPQVVAESRRQLPHRCTPLAGSLSGLSVL